MPRLSPSDARAILSTLGNPLHDFHALRSEDVQRLIDAADARRYRKPRNAPGSRARMFHAYVTRAAEAGR
jgi:hypothetical protein